MDSIIARLTGSMSAEIKDELEALEATISEGKGKQKLHAVMDDNYVRLMRRQGDARVAEIKKLIKGVAAIYNENTKGMVNPYLETVRRPVVALDPKTLEVVRNQGGLQSHRTLSRHNLRVCQQEAPHPRGQARTQGVQHRRRKDLAVQRRP